MTQSDTGRTEIPFGPFDVCIWASPFLVQYSPIEGTPHQCPFRGIFAEPLNHAITTTKRTTINKASHYSPLDANSLWTLSKVSLQYPLEVATHKPHSKTDTMDLLSIGLLIVPIPFNATRPESSSSSLLM
jgi:hypothetical protein